MAVFRRVNSRALVLCTSLLALSACTEGIDLDFRNSGTNAGTSQAARQATERRPNPDDRGVISYSNFQVAVAKRGDTVADVADRIGLDATELASHNGLTPDVQLRNGEVLALPRRVDAENIGTSTVDVTELASSALDRVEAEESPASTVNATTSSGVEPIQHQVVRGETAYSIARLYNVSVRSLADWNGLDSGFTVREGQYLLIPIAKSAKQPFQPAPEIETTTVPGEGTEAPEPPSASKPLPEEEETPPNVNNPEPALDLSNDRSGSSSAKFIMPVDGSIVRAYEKGRSDGIDIAASDGASVRAAGSGTVAAITRDTEGVPILVLRHDGNLLTVYANIKDVVLKKGDKVSRGQTIAKVRGSTLHFEVREGFDSVNPVDFLN